MTRSAALASPLATAAIPRWPCWTSAAQHMTRAEVGAALGDNAEREAALAKALAINPRVAHPRAELIWFGFD